MKYWYPLIAAFSGFGALEILFSYVEDSFFLPLLAGLIIFAGSFLLQKKKQSAKVPLIILSVFLFLLPLISTSLQESTRAFLLPLLTVLKEPYNIELTLPKATEGATPFLFDLYVTALFSILYLWGEITMAGRIIASLSTFSLLFIGFYFGEEPSLFGTILSVSYALTCPLVLRGKSYSPLSAYALSLALGFLLIPLVPESKYQQPSFLSSLQETIVETVDPYDPIFHAGNAYAGLLKGTKDHQRLGSSNGIRYTGRIIADMESKDTPKRLYLRSIVLSEYKNNHWEVLPSSSYSSISSLFDQNQGEWYAQSAWLMEVIARSPALSTALENYLPNGVTVSSLKKDFSIDQVYERTSLFLLPYDASFGAPLFSYDHAPTSKEGKAYSTYWWNIPDGALISFLTRESSADPYYATYVNGEAKYRKFVYDTYTKIPEEEEETLKAFGPITKVATLSEKRQRVEEIRAFLAKNYEYSTNPGKTPKGKDFISYFLLDSKKGYCTSFASSAVMLLRASGIPARYVVGLTVTADEVNSAPLSPSGLHKLSLNDRHAHAWAEVYVDGLGWRPVEMTPGYGNENPFPIPEDKKRNNENNAKDPHDGNQKENGKGNQDPRQNQKNEQQKQQHQEQLQKQQQKLPPIVPSQNPSKGFLLWISFFVIATCLFLYRWTRATRLISSAFKNQKRFNRLISYGKNLAKESGIPIEKSYEAQIQAARANESLAPYAAFLELLIAAKFQGIPLTVDQRKEAADLIRNMRKAILKEKTLMQKVLFILWKGL